MIIITGKARLKEGAKQRLLEEAKKMAQASRAEEGCHAYRFAFDLEDDQVVTVHEQWASEEALAAHFAQPHFGAFVSLMGEALEPGAEFTKWVGAEGQPLF